MKQIREITPWAESFSVKLVSGKVKQTVPLSLAQGPAGNYQRKTYVVKGGDTLGRIAHKHGSTAQEMAQLNHIGVNSIIRPGQVLKLPLSAANSSAVPAPPTTQAPAPAAAAQVAPPVAASPPVPSVQPAPPAAAATTSPTPVYGPAPSPPAGQPTQAESAALPQADPQTERDEMDLDAPTTNLKAETALPSTPVSEDRGENGSPKTTVGLVCPNACIKLGDTGPLVEELNIRLAGFGGTLTPSSNAPLSEFTQQTEKAVKQFQRDYMGVPETGKVCASFLLALDEFRARFPISLASMKCPCNHCNGFGHGYTSSADVDFHTANPIHGTEYPGIHRVLLWIMRSALFYTRVKDASLNYSFRAISSGYRCWHNNKLHARITINHMGNALDIQFGHGGADAACSGAVLENLRKKIFKERIGAYSVRSSNTPWLEPSSLAPNWVHIDVSQYNAQYKHSQLYAVTQSALDGDSMVEIARREGRLSFLSCGGLSLPDLPTSISQIQNQPDDSGLRIAVESLSISPKGVDFIKGWEKCGLIPYNDSEGFCTIGWGHLVDGKRSCESMQNEAVFASVHNGISQELADRLFLKDLSRFEDRLKRYVQVPLFQHEYDALMSLVFNLGDLSKCPKLITKLNTCDYKGCCNEFSDITNGGKRGLVKRRKAEMNLFNNKVYDASH